MEIIFVLKDQNGKHASANNVSSNSVDFPHASANSVYFQQLNNVLLSIRTIQFLIVDESTIQC